MINNVKVSFHNPNNTKKPIYFRQSLNGLGIYNNIEFVYNDITADYHILETWVNNFKDIEGKNIIYLNQEPPEIRLPKKDILDMCCLAITPFRLEHKIKQFMAPPVLQWTYGINSEMKAGVGHVYSLSNKDSLGELLTKEAPIKNKLCSMIVSNKYYTEYHKKRLDFTNILIDHFKNKIDFFGFGVKEIKDKKDAIDPYLYSIAIENCNHNNYWTEKISDVFLGFAKPIYFGTPNIADFYNDKSITKINIDERDEAISIIENCLENPAISYPETILDSRRKALLDYNMLRIISVAIQDTFLAN